MNKISMHSLPGLLRLAGSMLQIAAGRLLRLRWPQLLLVCFGLALLIVILPTALFLFLALMLAKFVVSLFGGQRREPRLLPKDRMR